jgi:hypothetical protein
MAYGLVTEDFVAICLTLLEGDAQRSTWELIQAVEEYQTRQNGRFGTTENDLKQALYHLCINHGFFTYEECNQPAEKLFYMPFSQLIPIILKEYQTFYCNDEGQDFIKEPVPGHPWRRDRLLACFEGTPTAAEVRNLLAELGWSLKFLEFFLEGRAQYWEEDSPVEEALTHILRLR